ncbi:hypothetical protein ACIQ7Q_04830 [Streptomyces sp. NPDC096176]|uniref:hypothetical protein n=1 Tax=Streptomyces sp. NPDC096176 TaxID=3366079 RepID=UPI00382CEA55
MCAADRPGGQKLQQIVRRRSTGTVRYRRANVLAHNVTMVADCHVVHPRSALGCIDSSAIRRTH